MMAQLNNCLVGLNNTDFCDAPMSDDVPLILGKGTAVADRASAHTTFSKSGHRAWALLADAGGALARAIR
jgi:hypothetical protein